MAGKLVQKVQKVQFVEVEEEVHVSAVLLEQDEDGLRVVVDTTGPTARDRKSFQGDQAAAFQSVWKQIEALATKALLADPVAPPSEEGG